ncbi:DUF3108 domain-containing protein [Acetobacter farinalis]|uniref:DUF3108 domain-containing protein n=1 Tax=Acetobacter farinalis TaxID=1260984 RepID=A0ABT3Q678_9PROT|nr:DUF3108 domain-containing protein [Acetobacter farinalis]MCX2560759.1 DUF3108 domain-containing protein [Acetobacter farinalis]NHO29410.1 DUF3108 domain-containing protein [Acetobacter farinalis]
MPRLRLLSGGTALLRSFMPGLCTVFLLGGGSAAPARADGVLPQTIVKYRVYAHGFNVMDIQASYRLSESQYGITARVKTGGFFGMFMKTNLQTSAQGHFSGAEVEPALFDSAGWSRGRNRHVSVVYRDQMPEVTLIDPVETDRESVPAADKLGAIDTLSALMNLLHQVRTSQSCGGQEKVFDGMRLSTLSIHPAGLQHIPSGGPLDWGEDALRCDFVAQQTEGFKFSSEKSKLRNPQPGRAWFEKVGEAGFVAVRVEVDHPKLGRITIVMDGPPQQAS